MDKSWCSLAELDGKVYQGHSHKGCVNNTFFKWINHGVPLLNLMVRFIKAIAAKVVNK